MRAEHDLCITTQAAVVTLCTAMVRGERQMESLTVSWMPRAELRNTLEALLEGSAVDEGPVQPRIDEADDHHCPSCA